MSRLCARAAERKRSSVRTGSQPAAARSRLTSTVTWSSWLVLALDAVPDGERAAALRRGDVVGVGDFGAADLRPGRAEAVADEDGAGPAGEVPNRPIPAGVESAAVRRCSSSEEVGIRNAAPLSAQSNKLTTLSNTMDCTDQPARLACAGVLRKSRLRLFAPVANSTRGNRTRWPDRGKTAWPERGVVGAE
jgi:hypothetical protein